MQQALAISQSTVGKKVLIALTGLVMFGFTVGHLTGNLLIFAGRDAMKAYAEFLAHNWEITWPTRIVLLLSVLTHIALTTQLLSRNAAARPTPYKHGRKDQLTTYAARTMTLTGPVLAAFIIFHLAHLTFGVPMGAYEHLPHDPYPNLVNGMSIWWVAAIYIFANLLLGLHLIHGVWSALQSIGATHPRYHVLRSRLAVGATIFVAGGNVLIPVLILANVIG